MHGIPRIPWEAEGVFDGVSEYQLDRDGMIYEHSVDNIIFRDPPVFNLPILFAQISTASRVTSPIPSVCFEKMKQWSSSISAFSWMELCFVLSVIVSILQHQRYEEEMNVAI